MGKIEFTSRQELEIAALKQNKLQRINIYDGSVRSGKTWITAIVWVLWVACQKDEGEFLMCAKTLTSLKRNVLDLLITLFGEAHISYSISQKEARIFGKRIMLEGASDARSEGKIRGLTLKGAYCDELTLFPEDFFTMLLSRLSLPGAKLFATTNPDSPNHWLYKNYLHPEIKEKKGLDLRHEKFLLTDNTTLPQDYVDNLTAEFTGVFYDRFIKGLWVVAEGLIYSNFSAEKHIVKAPEQSYDEYFVSCDYGTLNAFVALLWGRNGKAWHCLREYYHSGRESRNQKTDDEYYKDLELFIGDMPVEKVVIDPSAASFITLIRKKGKFAVRAADNAVLDGIRETAAALNMGLLFFDESCKNTIKEFGLYAWDTKLNEDKPIKENDHCMDAVRYLCKTMRIAIPERKSLV